MLATLAACKSSALISSLHLSAMFGELEQALSKYLFNYNFSYFLKDEDDDSV